MRSEKLLGHERRTTRAPGSAPELHLGSQRAIYDFGLHRAAREIWTPIPLGDSARRILDRAAQGAFGWAFTLLDDVVRIGFHLLADFGRDLAAILGHQLLPTRMPRVR